MNDIINIKGVRGRINANGDPELNLEDVARGWGFTRVATSGNTVVRWERVKRYLGEFGFMPTCGHGGEHETKSDEGLPKYIPENIVYKLGFKAKNEIAVNFQNMLADEILPAIRKHGAYLTPAKIEEVLSDPDTIIELATRLKEERNKRLLAEQHAEALSVQLDESKHWYTIKRVAQLNRISWKSLDWRLLKVHSKKMGLKVDKIFDANFGTVNCYHEDVWKEVYPNLVY